MMASAFRFASLIAVLSTVSGAGIAAGSAAQAAPPPSGSATVTSARANGLSGVTTRLAEPCRYRYGVTDCQGINTQISTYVFYHGYVSGCTFKWRVTWGDGSKNTTVEQAGPPDGYVLLASHRYDPEAQASYTFVEKGSLLGGSCTITNGHEIFRSLSYVALGDSYSSGTGATDYLPGTGFQSQGGNECLRSVHAYSELADENLGNPTPNKKRSLTFLFRSCNGAVINDFNNPQVTADKKKVPAQLSVLDGLSASVRLVTFTIGGNDALFA
jgi:hypothetical protein